MNPELAHVQQYYDEHVAGKLKDFVEGNDRVEQAWQTVQEWGQQPRRILEVGCGIGAFGWRMRQFWRQAEVIGLDVSPRSLELGETLFGDAGIRFVQGPLTPGLIAGPFDLIVLIDVYEHIAAADRPVLHQALQDLLADHGRLILAFPTPRHLAWLKAHMPEQIQPVDEDIDAGTLHILAHDLGKELLMYRHVHVWHEGDYAHAVFGAYDGWQGAPAPLPRPGWLARIRQSLIPSDALPSPRADRLARVHQKLGKAAYPG